MIELHIRRFQEMMKQLYFQRDSKRGAEKTYEWLMEELEELKEAFETSDKEAIEKEFADVIAWLASLANLKGIDLETAAINKYNGKCPKCKKSPCHCKF